MSSPNPEPDKDIASRVEEILESTYQKEPDFNTTLNAQGPVFVHSLDREQGAYDFDPAAVLYWLDRNAYYAELQAWQQAGFQKRNAQALKQLKTTDQLTEFNGLVEAIRRRRVVPFVGAGLSHFRIDPDSDDYAYPLWGESLRQLISKVSGVDKAAVNKKLDAFDFLGAAQLLYDADDVQVRNFIRTKFSKTRVSVDSINGPANLLKEMSHGCVITTNFDSVVEMVFGKGTFDAYMHGMQNGNKFVRRLINGDRCILKLHGDADDESSYVFTENQYKAAYGDPIDFKLPLPRSLRHIFVSQSLLFLGCSLEEDRTLQLFANVRDSSDFDIPDHFALLPAPSKQAARQAKASRLLKLGIQPVWYPKNKHDYVEKYLSLALDLSRGTATVAGG